MSEVKTPWKDYMGDVPMHLDYFQGSMFEAVARIAEQYPNNIAFDFMGKSTTYKKMVQEIERCAKSLKTLGVRPGDKITIAMPNCPQAIYMFYAVNLVGGIANMIHPLSAEKEIEFYLNESQSTTAITLGILLRKPCQAGALLHGGGNGAHACILSRQSGQFLAEHMGEIHRRRVQQLTGSGVKG